MGGVGKSPEIDVHSADRIVISSSVEGEVDVVLFVLQYIRDNGPIPVAYTLPSEIPTSVTQAIAQKKDGDAQRDLTLWMSQSFNILDFNEVAAFVEERWRPLEKKYLGVMEQITGLVIPPKIKGDIVRYGVGGMCFPSQARIAMWWNGDKVNPRFREKYPEHLVGHETTHLLLHNLAERAHLSYAQKERLIDLMFTKTPLFEVFPEYTAQLDMDQSVDSKFSWEAMRINPEEAVLKLKET